MLQKRDHLADLSADKFLELATHESNFIVNCGPGDTVFLPNDFVYYFFSQSVGAKYIRWAYLNDEVEGALARAFQGNERVCNSKGMSIPRPISSSS